MHPFFHGQQQRLIDIEGQVDRFYKKLQARQEFVDQKKARETAKTSLEKSVNELGLPARTADTLVKAGITTVGQIIAKLGEGESALLGIDGFGRKSLIDLKKLLRAQGYELPAAADDVAV
jgi:large subunit ribosomal protein L31